MLRVRDNSWAPIKGLMELNREMNDLFNGSYDEPVKSSAMEFHPRVDVSEGDGDYLIQADLPGVSEKDVEVTLNDGVLTVKGQRVQESKDESKNYYRTERLFGFFQRQFSLPKNVNMDKIAATFKDGVLNITLPISEEAKERKITINA